MMLVVPGIKTGSQKFFLCIINPEENLTKNCDKGNTIFNSKFHDFYRESLLTDKSSY